MNPPPDETPAAAERQPVDPDLLGERAWMRRLALSLTGDDHGAADLEQDTWVKLLRNPPDRKVSLRAWIATVMRNTARNSHRGRSRRAAREELWTRDQPTEVETGRDGLDDDVAEVLRRAVERLGEPYHEAISLRFYRQLTPKEIGEHLGVPAATVRTRLRRALQQLRQELDGEHGGERSLWAPSLAAWALRPRGDEAGAVAVGGGVLTVQLVLVACLVPLLAGAVWWWVGAGVVTVPAAPAASVVDRARPAGSDRALPTDLPAPEPRRLEATPGLATEVSTPAVAAAAPADEPFELTVLDEVGRPLEGARVTVLPRDEPGLEHPGAPVFQGTPIPLARSALLAHELLPGSGLARIGIGAPGRFSREINLDFGRLDELTVILGEAGTIEVVVWAADHEEVVLRCSSGGRVLQEYRPTRDPDGAFRATWTDLKPGRCVVEVFCDHAVPVSLIPDEDPGDGKFGKTVQLAAGQHERVELRLDTPHRPRWGTGRLGGTVLVEDHLAGLVSLDVNIAVPGRLHWLLGREGRPPAATFTPGALRADGRRELHWELDRPLVAGDYEVMVLPFGVLAPVAVPEHGRASVQLEVPVLEALTVDVVSGLDGRTIDGLELVWQPAWDRGPHRKGVVEVPLEPDGQGAWTLLAAPGPGRLVARRTDDPASGSGWRGELVLDDLPADGRDLVVRVWPLTPVEVILVNDDGRPIPTHQRFSRLSLTCLAAGPGVSLQEAFVINETQVYRRFLVGAPGRYRLEGLGRTRTVPLDPREFELVPGQPVRLELPLPPEGR